jgi:Na+/H+-dicarboxylate symporter
MAKWQSFIKNNMLTIMTVVGVLSGTAVGCILRSLSDQKWTPRETMYLMFPGEIFLRMLKSLIIPLLMASIISAVGGLDLSLSKRIALRSILYYATTTVCAVILGIILVITIKPGVGAEAAEKGGTSKEEEALKRKVLTQDTLLDLIRNLFPPNLIQACFQQVSCTRVSN